MSPATPFLEPALSSEEKKEVLERIDMCREENQGRIEMVENVGKFVHPQQMSDFVPKKTQEELEPPDPPKAAMCHLQGFDHTMCTLN